MDKQIVHYKDLGIIDYKAAWDYQETLLQQNVALKMGKQNIDVSLIDTKNFYFFANTPLYILWAKVEKRRTF